MICCQDSAFLLLTLLLLMCTSLISIPLQFVSSQWKPAKDIAFLYGSAVTLMRKAYFISLIPFFAYHKGHKWQKADFIFNQWWYIQAWAHSEAKPATLKKTTLTKQRWYKRGMTMRPAKARRGPADGACAPPDPPPNNHLVPHLQRRRGRNWQYWPVAVREEREDWWQVETWSV